MFIYIQNRKDFNKDKKYKAEYMYNSKKYIVVENDYGNNCVLNLNDNGIIIEDKKGD